jgi:urease accessory protein UreH
MDIDCASGSAAHITTQAATKVYTARQNFVTQLVNLRAGAGAVLEYLPCGAAVRLLGTSGAAVQAALRSVWSAARLQLLGAPAPNRRKG